MEELGNKGPKYVIDDSLRERAKNVKEALQERFFYVEVDRILFVRRVLGGETSRETAAVRRIYPPYDLLNPQYRYILEVIDVKFKGLSEESKNRVIEHELMHIPQGFDGTLVKHDVEDFADILEKYGIRWLKRRGEEDEKEEVA